MVYRECPTPRKKRFPSERAALPVAALITTRLQQSNPDDRGVTPYPCPAGEVCGWWHLRRIGSRWSEKEKRRNRNPEGHRAKKKRDKAAYREKNPEKYRAQRAAQKKARKARRRQESTVEG